MENITTAFIVPEYNLAKEGLKMWKSLHNEPVNTPGKCIWQHYRGLNAGTFCGNPVVEGKRYCNFCLRKDYVKNLPEDQK